jgi:hypothetical protein
MIMKATDVLHDLIADGASVGESVSIFVQKVQSGEIKIDSIVVRPDRIFPMIVRPRGGLTGIPTAECLESHLPDGRAPTMEELEAAWDACIGQ